MWHKVVGQGHIYIRPEVKFRSQLAAILTLCTDLHALCPDIGDVREYAD
jgi:hypothetical protein